MDTGPRLRRRGDFVRDLPDAAIDAHLERARTLRPGDLSLMHLYPVNGAVHRVGPDERRGAPAMSPGRW